MKIGVIDTLTIDDLAHYHVVVLTQVNDIKWAIEANEFCHARKIGFVMS